MSSEANKALMRRFYEEFWCKGNADAVGELVHADFIDHQEPVDGPPGRRHGLEAMKALVRDWRAGFPDMSETIEDLIAEGDRVCGRFTLRGTHRGEFRGIPPTGRAIEISGIDVVRVAGGKIIEFWYSEDTLGLYQQLGAFPPDLPRPS